MIIVGLTGDIGHGKTTFADLLAEQSKSSQHFESWELIAEVACPLKEQSTVTPDPTDLNAVNAWLVPLSELIHIHLHRDIAHSQLKITEKRLQDHPKHYEKLFEYLGMVQRDPNLITTPLDIDTKEEFRPLLQWIGGYLAVLSTGIWYTELTRRIKRLDAATINLVTVGGLRFPSDAEILRNAGGIIVDINRPGLATRDAGDLTERERSDIIPDTVIQNDADLLALRSCAEIVWTDLQRRELAVEYSCVATARLRV